MQHVELVNLKPAPGGHLGNCKICLGKTWIKKLIVKDKYSTTNSLEPEI